MASNELRYDRMVEDALRGVVGKALTHAATRGLPGDHHFYITFRTDDPGVVMPDHLRHRYPSEMTIVLQHQFWGLEVGSEAFSVTLTFANVPERLTVPYAAVVAFADPSVRFGLQFDVADKSAEPAKATSEIPVSGANEATEKPAAKPAARPAVELAVDNSQENVVPLDTFRRK